MVYVLRVSSRRRESSPGRINRASLVDKPLVINCQASQSRRHELYREFLPIPRPRDSFSKKEKKITRPPAISDRLAKSSRGPVGIWSHEREVAISWPLLTGIPQGKTARHVGHVARRRCHQRLTEVPCSGGADVCVRRCLVVSVDPTLLRGHRVADLPVTHSNRLGVPTRLGDWSVGRGMKLSMYFVNGCKWRPAQCRLRWISGDVMRWYAKPERFVEDSNT